MDNEEIQNSNILYNQEFLELYTSAMSYWIPVYKRLPEINHCVLVYCPYSYNIYCAVLHDSNTWHYAVQKGGPVISEKVSYWRQLPNGPRIINKYLEKG